MIQKIIDYYRSLPWCKYLKHKWVISHVKRSAMIPDIKNVRRITFAIRTCSRCGKTEAHLAPITENMVYHWVPYVHNRKVMKVDKRWIL